MDFFLLKSSFLVQYSIFPPLLVQYSLFHPLLIQRCQDLRTLTGLGSKKTWHVSICFKFILIHQFFKRLAADT